MAKVKVMNGRHGHDGKIYLPGDVFEVDDASAYALRPQCQIIELSDPNSKPPAQPTAGMEMANIKLVNQAGVPVDLPAQSTVDVNPNETLGEQHVKRRRGRPRTTSIVTPAPTPEATQPTQ